MRIYYTYLLLSLFFTDLLLANEDLLILKKKFYIKSEDLSGPKKTLEGLLGKPFVKKILSEKDFERPSQCPLKSMDAKLLHQKLRLVSKALQHSKCLDQNKQILSGLEEISSQAQLTTKALTQEDYQATVSSSDALSILNSDEGTAEVTTTYLDFTADNITAADSATVLKYLGKITQDKECLDTLKNGNFLSTLGNIAMTVGQSSLLVPSPSGFLFSAAGIGFGATLKVIAGLFQSQFDWSLPEERKQFQELNCSFFDLRRDVEKARIFETNPKQKQESITQLSSEIEAITIFHKDLLAKQDIFKKKINLLKEEYIAKNKRTNMAKNIKKITAFLLELNTALQLEQKDFSYITQLTILFSEDYIKTIDPLENQEKKDFYDFFVEILSQFNWKNSKFLYDLDPILLLRKYINPLVKNLTLYKSYLEETIAPLSVSFAKEKCLICEKNNEEIVKKTNEEYTSLLKKSADSLTFLRNQKEIISNYSQQKDFDSYDNSSYVDYDIIEEYLTIQNLIYGKLGYSYLKYFREEIYDNVKLFKKNYKKFNFDTKLVPFKKEAPWHCRDAQNLLLTWQNADTASEVSWDFLETNVGLFHKNVPKFKFFLKFIPVGRSDAKKIYRASRNAEIAKKLLYKDEKYHKNELDRFGHRYRKNLGKIMLSAKELVPKKREVALFFEKHQCRKHL